MFFFTSKYSLTDSTAGIKVMPNPNPINSENVTNKNSTPVAKELRAKPRVAMEAPHIMTGRDPYFLQRKLPINPKILINL